jgi:hypothetical protein
MTRKIVAADRGSRECLAIIAHDGQGFGEARLTSDQKVALGSPVKRERIVEGIEALRIWAGKSQCHSRIGESFKQRLIVWMIGFIQAFSDVIKRRSAFLLTHISPIHRSRPMMRLDHRLALHALSTSLNLPVANGASPRPGSDE